MMAYVLYTDGWPAGVYRSYAEIAELLGVSLSSARWYGTAEAKRRGIRNVVQRVEVEEFMEKVG